MPDLGMFSFEILLYPINLLTQTIDDILPVFQQELLGILQYTDHNLLEVMGGGGGGLNFM